MVKEDDVVISEANQSKPEVFTNKGTGTVGHPATLLELIMIMLYFSIMFDRNYREYTVVVQIVDILKP